MSAWILMLPMLAGATWSLMRVPVVWGWMEKGLGRILSLDRVVSHVMLAAPERTFLQQVQGADHGKPKPVEATGRTYQFVTTCPACTAPGNPYFCGFKLGNASSETYEDAAVGGRKRYLRRQCQVCGFEWSEHLDVVPVYRWPEDPKPQADQQKRCSK